MHDDRYSKHLGCLCLSLVDGLSYEEEPVSPPHERLGVNVLVILREVQFTTQTLVYCSTIVLQPCNPQAWEIADLFQLNGLVVTGVPLVFGA